jgi:hypothetical protein
VVEGTAAGHHTGIETAGRSGQGQEIDTATGAVVATGAKIVVVVRTDETEAKAAAGVGRVSFLKSL